MNVVRLVASWVCVVALAAPAVSSGQQPARFETASVKPNRSGDLLIKLDFPTPDRLTAANVPLRELVRFAYDVQDARLQGGPDWIRSERFDIVAKADRSLGAWGPSGPPAEALAMLRALLSERFALTTHRETRTLPVYALVRARENGQLGPELRRSSLDCEGAATPGQPVLLPPASDPARSTCGMRIGPGQMVVGGTPLPQLATVLSQFVQRIVIDRTELRGPFDWHLNWTPERLLPPGPPPPGAPPLPPIDPNGPSIFAALQEQLGLKLEPRQTPLDVIVIDRVDRPTAD
jgi:uncharacterized protein (TIGR03435 family)